MTTNLATILATKIRTALEVDHSHDDAHTLATIGVLVQQAGLSLTPLPEPQPETEQGSDTQSHPSGVTVTKTGWKVTVDGKFAGLVDARAGGFKAYTPDAITSHDSLNAAVSYIVAQHRTPSPKRSIERGRDDDEADRRAES